MWGIALALSLWGSGLWADDLRVPFERTIKLDVLKTATKLPPAELVAYINSLGVKTYVYPSKHPANPDFARMEVAPEAIQSGFLKRLMNDVGNGAEAEDPKAEFQDVGAFIPETDDEFGKFGPFLIVSASAKTYTLLHELGHVAFYLNETPEVRRQQVGIGRKAAQNERELFLQATYFERYAESSNKYQRDHLMGVLLRDIEIEGMRAKNFATEEVAVETLLSKLIVPGNRYYLSERQKEGLKYAYNNIMLVYINVERRELLFQNLRYLFEHVAGSTGSTSVTEREEIIASIQQYRAAIDAAKDPIIEQLQKLEDPQWAKNIRPSAFGGMPQINQLN